MLKGDTEDISILRFFLFCPVWFYASMLDFSVDQMKPGFFLGIDTSVRDSFSYIIVEGKTVDDLPMQNIRTIVGYIVQKRKLDDNLARTVHSNIEGNLSFVNVDGKELFDFDLSEEELFATYTTSEVEIIEMEDPRSYFNQVNTGNPNPLLPLADQKRDAEMDDDVEDDYPDLAIVYSSVHMKKMQLTMTMITM